MGQYYRIIFLSDSGSKGNEIIRFWIDPSVYSGIKLMEHAYFSYLLSLVESLLSKNGMFYKGRIVWAGDYGDEEQEKGENLYEMAQRVECFRISTFKQTENRYIINHTKKQYVNKTKSSDIHPLALLVAEGNQRGGGDYYGNNAELCGTWARDVISMEDEIPESYTELVCDFN